MELKLKYILILILVSVFLFMLILFFSKECVNLWFGSPYANCRLESILLHYFEIFTQKLI